MPEPKTDWKTATYGTGNPYIWFCMGQVYFEEDNMEKAKSNFMSASMLDGDEKQKNKFMINNELLLDAVRANDYSKTEILIREGADVNYVREETGSTPLYFAVAENYLKIAELLLINKADINVKYERGQSVLHIAAFYEEYAMVELILQYNPEVNIRDNFGNTPLWTACYTDNLEIIELLLQHGADAYTKNIVGEILVGKKKQPLGVSHSPYSSAFEDENEALLTLFEKYKNE